MRNPKIMAVLLAASSVGLAVSATAQAEDVSGSGNSQEATKATETDRQQRRAERGEKREQRQRRASKDVDSNTPDRRQRRAERSDRREQRQSRATRDRETGSAGQRPIDRGRRSANLRDGDAKRAQERRAERLRSEDRQARRDRRQNRADRSDAGRHARWRDRRDHREFNRRDFGHARSERRRVGYGKRRHDERPGVKRGTFDRRVDRRLDNLRKRTRAGWRNGEITQRELKRVRKDRRKIVRMDRRFGSDGRYTKHERRKLNRALDRASNRIYRSKHNDRVARHMLPRGHRR